jgi:hypothetical protein
MHSLYAPHLIRTVKPAAARVSVLLSALFLAACSSNPNSIWFERGMMAFEVLEVGPRQYKLTANGAGAHTSEQVERGFMQRAGQLCEGRPFTHNEISSEPYQYGSTGGGYSFRHSAFKSVGIVTCK